MPKNKEKEARLWGMGCHLAALVGFVGIPFGHVLGPLVVWLIKKDEHPSINEQGKEALNFQISMTIYAFVSFLLIFIGIGILLLAMLAIADLVLIIIASVRVSNGEPFRYPAAIRLIK